MYLNQNVVVSGNLYASYSLIVGSGEKSEEGDGWQWHFLNHPELYPVFALTYETEGEEARVFRAIIVRDDEVEDLSFDESDAPGYKELLYKVQGDG